MPTGNALVARRVEDLTAAMRQLWREVEHATQIVDRGRSLTHLGISQAINFYVRVCSRPQAAAIFAYGPAAFDEALNGEAPCSRFEEGGAIVNTGDVTDEDRPNSSLRGAADMKKCLRDMQSAMRPQEQCGAFSETADQQAARKAVEEAEKLREEYEQKQKEADDIEKVVEHLREAAASNPNDERAQELLKQAEGDLAAAKGQAKSAKDAYDGADTRAKQAVAASDQADAQAAADRARAQALADAEFKEKLWAGIATLAALTCETGVGCLVAVLAVEQSLNAAADVWLLNQPKECLAYSPARGIAVPFLVNSSRQSSGTSSRGAGEITGGLGVPPFFSGNPPSRNPPDFLGLYNYCTCVAGLGEISQFACPSAEDRRRMDCLANPYGPDGGPKWECIALLRSDNEEASPRLGACSLMSCRADAMRSRTADGQCACITPRDVAVTLPNQQCQRLNCGSELCICSSASVCRCGRSTPGAGPVIQPPPVVGPPGRAPLGSGIGLPAERGQR